MTRINKRLVYVTVAVVVLAKSTGSFRLAAARCSKIRKKFQLFAVTSVDL